MNWKCLLVGLALVFPGTLLSVQGRYFNQESSAVDEQEGFFNNLYNLFQQRRQPARFTSHRDEPFVGTQRRFSNRDSIISNLNQADDNINNINSNVLHTTNNNNVQQLDEQAADSLDGKTDFLPYPPSKGREKLPAAETGAKTREGKGQGEVNHAVQEPLALAQSAEAAKAEFESHGHVTSNTAFIMLVAGCTMLAAVGAVGAGVCWYKYHRSAKAASVVDYPAYGVTGPTKDRVPSPGDRKLAHSAQMYHYQHQKQQMMALQSTSSGEMKHDASDDESVEDNDDADYTVYECPGLAPTGEMEVKNPLFRGDDTPSTPANDDSRPSPEY